MKFLFYLTDTHSGKIVGTNKRKVALDCAESEDFFVLDATTSQWLQPDGVIVDIEAMD